MNESQFVLQLKKWLLSQPQTVVYKIHGGRYQDSGIPDLIGCCQGYFFSIEAKVGDNKTSLIQDYQINRIEKAGGLAFVINPKNVAIFKKDWIDGKYFKRT